MAARTLRGNYARWLALGALAFLSHWAWAGPEEDYQIGLKAYRGGDLVGSMSPLRRAADAGHAGAQALLGDILDKAESDEEAVAYFRKSAEQGNADGQYGLGAMYAAGEGVKKDPAEARKWITRAADQGHKLAVNTLAQAYITGGLGLEESALRGADALTRLRQAAGNDYLPAIDVLAKAYRAGDYGLAPDAKEAEQLTARANKLRGVKQTTRGRSGAQAR